MTARCPECQARYRIERERIGPRGARLRCTRCETIFRVHAPDASDEQHEEPAPVAPVAPPQSFAPPRVTRPRVGVARVLVAESDVAVAKAVGEFVADWQLDAELVHDGREALVRLFRQPPALVILGGRLARIEAQLVCELARRSRVHGSTRLIRVASLEEPAGVPEFDADATLEQADLPEGLGPLLERLGIGVRPDRPAPAPVPVAPRVPARAPAPVAAQPVASPRPAAPAPAPAASASTDPELVGALRLARIIVSDIVLYNEEKFATAAARGAVGRALDAELAEARAMFNARVPERVRAGRDLLIEELERRAESHRARG